jgi:hypothetical protein
VPDRGGQGQDALQDPDRDPDTGAAAVAFQVQLALEGLVDRLDKLRSGRNSPAPARAGARGGERAPLERLSPFPKALLGILHSLEGDQNGATDRR